MQQAEFAARYDPSSGEWRLLQIYNQSAVQVLHIYVLSVMTY